jgi:hypothetical protein
MADTREVKVTTEDIKSVDEKLREFTKGLPEGEQNVMAWLLGRAADAGAEKPDFLPKGRPQRAGARRAGRLVRGPLNDALGIAQFDQIDPGTAAAGSSIGVTGTVMF